MILTPEIIEAGARAILQEWCDDQGYGCDPAKIGYDFRRFEPFAKACLTASLPGVIEAVKKELEGK